MKETTPSITLIIPAALGSRIEMMEAVSEQTRPVAILVEAGPHPSVNRNRGAARATTPLLAFTNAHTLLRADWAERVEDFFRQHPQIDIVGGPQLNYAGDPYFAKASGDALASPFCTGNMSRRYRAGAAEMDADEASVTSANLICRRHVFEKVRFDEALYPGEDPKFVTDARAVGFKLAYVPDIIAFNRRRSSWRALAKQMFHYGAARVQKETPGELLRHPLFFAPGALVIYFALVPLLTLWSVWWLIPLVLYFGAALAFAGRRAMESRRLEYVLVLPALFIWIHIAYGLGFLGRLLLGRWRH